MTGISDAEALEVPCPKCGAPRQDRCVRLFDKVIWVDRNGEVPDPFYYDLRDRQVTVARAGDPCERVHNDRREFARRLIVRRGYAAARREYERTHPIERRVIERDQALLRAAIAEQARREHDELRRWLRWGGAACLLGASRRETVAS